MGVGMGDVADDDPGNEGATLGGNLVHAVFDLARGALKRRASSVPGGVVGESCAVRRYSVRRRMRSKVRVDLCSDAR